MSRYRELCRAVSQDGRVCVLYKDHKCEEHHENHHRSTWLDGE